MTSLELTSAITAIANALSCKLTSDEIALLSTIFVQLGDTLATIAAVQNKAVNNQNCPDNTIRKDSMALCHTVLS